MSPSSQTASLTPYDLEEDELDVILAEVQAVLKTEGINFHKE